MLDKIPRPSTVDRSNVDAVATAFLATTNIVHAGSESWGAGYNRAAYLTSDLEKSQITVDGGDALYTIDPAIWSQASKSKSMASIYAKSTSLQGVAHDSPGSTNRCYMITRVWTPTVNGSALTEPQVEDCLMLSKTGNQWSVVSEDLIGNGD